MEWRRGVYGYSTTMSAANLQTGDEIVRRLWYVQKVYLPYLLEVLINMKLVGDCRDTSSLSVRRPCRKVVNWVYHTSISFMATRISCQRKKLRHLPPYTTPISATSTTLGGIGIHHSTVTLGTGKLHTTFSHKTARLSRLSFQKSSTSTSWRHLLTSTTGCSWCSSLRYETWELGTSQINYRTLAGNLPHRSRACLNKIFLGQYIYTYIYTTIQIHKYIRKFYKHYKMEGEALELVNPTQFLQPILEEKRKHRSSLLFFSLSSCL